MSDYFPVMASSGGGFMVDNLLENKYINSSSASFNVDLPVPLSKYKFIVLSGHISYGSNNNYFSMILSPLTMIYKPSTISQNIFVSYRNTTTNEVANGVALTIYSNYATPEETLALKICHGSESTYVSIYGIR